MDGEALPLLHEQYSSLPHEDTYRVDDRVGVVWDRVVLSVCRDHDLKFNHRFLKNPLHPSYKLISQISYLIDIILPHTELLEAVLRARSTEITDSDAMIYRQFLSSFLSNSIVEDHTRSVPVTAGDFQTTKDLCADVNATINMPFFRKYESLKHFMGKVLKIIDLLSSSLQLQQLSAPSQIPPHTLFQMHKTRMTNKFQKNTDSGRGSGQEEKDIVLCIPCDLINSSISVDRASIGAKRRRINLIADKNDAFFGPNKHILNGFCPCCE